MGVWYIVSGIAENEYGKYNVSCIVYAVTVKEAINKASNYFCKDSKYYFTARNISRLDKNRVYEL